MRQTKWTRQFRKDYKHLKKYGRYDMNKLHQIITLLIQDKKLPEKLHDHSLSGRWRSKRDCHIQGDWILIYETGLNEHGLEVVIFHRTGNHANLFK